MNGGGEKESRNPRTRRRDFIDEYMDQDPEEPTDTQSDWSPSHSLWNSGLPNPVDPDYGPGYDSARVEDLETDPGVPSYGTPYIPYETSRYETVGPDDVQRIRAAELSRYQSDLRLILDDIVVKQQVVRTMSLAMLIESCNTFARRLTHIRAQIRSLGGTMEDPRYDDMLRWVEDIPEFIDDMKNLLDDVMRFRVVSKTMPKAFLIVRCSYYANTMIALKDKLQSYGVPFIDPRFNALLQWTQDILDTRDMRKTVLKKQRTQLRF